VVVFISFFMAWAVNYKISHGTKLYEKLTKEHNNFGATSMAVSIMAVPKKDDYYHYRRSIWESIFLPYGDWQRL